MKKRLLYLLVTMVAVSVMVTSCIDKKIKEPDDEEPPEMVLVEGGSFQMGSEDGDSDEKPVHSVTLSSFYIGKYEVTQQEYQAVMGKNPSHFKGDNLPVESVSWYAAVEYCNKLSIKEGLTPVYSIGGNHSPSDWSRGTITANWSATGYSLPTEAEWEYAARGGNKSSGFTYSGSNNLDDVGWYYENSGERRLNDRNRSVDNIRSNNCRTHPVGSKQPNELGIYDMSGNVYEWCWDWYDDYTSSSKTNPRGADSGSYRVVRGGGWYFDAAYCTVSFRNSDYASDRNFSKGFRVSRRIP